MAAPRPILLLTRPEAAARAFEEALPQEVRTRVDVLINPLLSIQVTGPLPEVEGIAGLIFTSANAVHAYQALGGNPTLPAIAVGENTAKAAREMGFAVDVAGGNADHLVQRVIEQGYTGPLMHLRGEHAIGDVAGRLTEAGVPTQEAILYDQRLETLRSETKAALSQDRRVIAPVFSPRTARQLGAESEGITNMEFAAISRAVADALPGWAAARTRIAAQPSRDCMIALVADMVAESDALERRSGCL